MLADLSWTQILILIISGLFVGFINTLAGGATAISLSVFLMLGLPPTVANGTNRIPVILQNITSVSVFRKKKLLDVKNGLKMGLPMIGGTLVGSLIAVDIDQEVFSKMIGVVLLIILVFMFYKPKNWTEGNPSLREEGISWKIYVLLFIFGIYGGLVHLGVGYFILATLVMGLGYNLVQANAIKSFLVLIYVPVSLLVFMLNGQVNYGYGLLHAIGNIIGAYIASTFAINWGANFVRWVMAVFIIVFALYLFGLVDVGSII